MKIILGSASPRRKELLKEIGVKFEVVTADVDEDVVTVADPGQNVLGRARLKAAAVRAIIPEGAIVIAADTTVADGVEMLNKPADESEAWRMLRQLRDHTHQVHTGVIVIGADGAEHTVVNSSDVKMRPYTDEEIAAYIETGDPMDKAGAYAIQHPQFRPVAEINGCYTGIMGLPLCDVAEILEICGVELHIPRKKKTEEVQAYYLCERCERLFNGK